ncbi:MAG: hypothetical protein D6781_10515 [Verrucomicrobia bacterium]|nr:MAG: hypothetical protein D6781_10515 [Verrucomicrobiota bacterium]
MEDFLKDRPVVEPEAAAVIDATKTARPPRPAAETESAPPAPFAPIGEAPTATPAGAERPAAPAPQAIESEHGARVETIVEGGRVTRIIITCSCGKVTEVACTY